MYFIKTMFMKLPDPNYPRITVDPAVCAGKPCIRGMRFPVATLLAYLAEGMEEKNLLADFPFLEPEDVGEALAFAKAIMNNGK